MGYENETKHQKLPRLIDSLSDIVVIKVSLGVYHAAAISNIGVVFTWGRGFNGQLGHGEVVDEVNNDKIQCKELIG